jgi:predicted N-acyltransferase
LNRGYASFEDFLGALSSRKRKDLRKERAAACEGLTIKHLTASDITEAHWDAFWVFYQDTGQRKWGSPYLTREAFSLLGERMGERIVLILAYDGANNGGRPIAGALNFIGADALYGRYWGCTREVRFLHFELCYHQAIEHAIARGLARVEAGAQGEHKIQRGYLPCPTWSAHLIAHKGLSDAVAEFLDAERPAMLERMRELAELSPFRREGGEA